MTYPIVLPKRRNPWEEALLGLAQGLEGAAGPIAGKIEQNKASQQKIMQAILSGDIPQEYLRTKEFRAYLEKAGKGNPFIEEALKNTKEQATFTPGTQITGQAIPESPLAGASLEPGGEKFASTKTPEQISPINRKSVMNKILSLQEAEQQIKSKRINEALETMIRTKRLELDFQKEGKLDPDSASRAAGMVAQIQTKYPNANVSWDEDGISIKSLTKEQRQEIQSTIRASDALTAQRTQDIKRQGEASYFQETEPERTRFSMEYQAVMELLDDSKRAGYSSSSGNEARKSIAKARLADLNKRIQQYNSLAEVTGRSQGIDPNVVESRKIPPYSVNTEKLLPTPTTTPWLSQVKDNLRDLGGGHLGVPETKEYPKDVRAAVEQAAEQYETAADVQLAIDTDPQFSISLLTSGIQPSAFIDAFEHFKKNKGKWR